MISGFWASFCCTGSAPKIGIDTCRERMSFFYKKNILTLSGSLGSRECEGHAERLIMDAEFLRPRCQFSKKTPDFLRQIKRTNLHTFSHHFFHLWSSWFDVLALIPFSLMIHGALSELLLLFLHGSGDSHSHDVHDKSLVVGALSKLRILHVLQGVLNFWSGSVIWSSCRLALRSRFIGQ